MDEFVSPESVRLNSILAQLPVPRRVLELGCGDCPVVAAPDAFHVAIDQNDVALQTAQIPAAARLFLAQADIVRLPFKARFDLILARHPDVDRHRDSWRLALTHAHEYLAARGVLLVTVYSLPEVDLIESWRIPLTHLFLDVYSLSAPDLIGRDRFVLYWQSD